MMFGLAFASYDGYWLRPNKYHILPKYSLEFYVYLSIWTRKRTRQNVFFIHTFIHGVNAYGAKWSDRFAGEK